MQEFDNLKDGEIIYKLVGPVLLKQEKFEADGTVKGRLEYIGSELYVLSPSRILLCLLTFFPPAFVSHLSVARDTHPPPPNQSSADDSRERQEKHIAELQKQVEGKRAEIMQIQAAAQAANQGAQQGKEVAA